MTHTKEDILGLTSDLVSCFLYYDRKNNKDFPVGCIEKAINEGIITTDEIVDKFREELEKMPRKHK